MADKYRHRGLGFRVVVRGYRILSQIFDGKFRLYFVAKLRCVEDSLERETVTERETETYKTEVFP